MQKTTRRQNSFQKTRHAQRDLGNNCPLLAYLTTLNQLHVVTGKKMSGGNGRDLV